MLSTFSTGTSWQLHWTKQIQQVHHRSNTTWERLLNVWPVLTKLCFSHYNERNLRSALSLSQAVKLLNFSCQMNCWLFAGVLQRYWLTACSYPPPLEYDKVVVHILLTKSQRKQHERCAISSSVYPTLDVIRSNYFNKGWGSRQYSKVKIHGRVSNHLMSSELSFYEYFYKIFPSLSLNLFPFSVSVACCWLLGLFLYLD